MQGLLKKIEEEKPLVHHITNNVTVNDCANITLYWGGLPVMAYAKPEVEEMVAAASALVLNIGTLNRAQVEAMIAAGKKANQLGVPVIFDPVGVGATELRTQSALRILEEVKVTVIKGNQAEISILAGESGEIKGVESVGEYTEIVESAKKLAAVEETIVVVSGPEDIVSNGKEVYKVSNGHPRLGEVVGTGCMLGSTIGVFCGVSEDYLTATLNALAAFGIAGEKAEQKVLGPASYKISFLDLISQMKELNLKKLKKITKIQS
ncbi:hydroxyethylthiazole kinase [Fuchsiella alkaliacetigena]|uniref:hydroxyethylthiazole kinase n=1 Tax=Fuchsiella alkaliacetigena TaxID=957042 RepID=UPI00200B3001|nr:hydroxyethylthiazole kinase [Fuchsiella alkaliacetigena]MCK8823897.1 hydroxyethylthiazole kinase [Fuchsiella alkaliacetigena]